MSLRSVEPAGEAAGYSRSVVRHLYEDCPMVEFHDAVLFTIDRAMESAARARSPREA